MDKSKLKENFQKVLDDPVIYDSTGEISEERFWEAFWREIGLENRYDSALEDVDSLNSRVEYLEGRIGDKNYTISELEETITDLNNQIKELKKGNSNV